MKNYLIIFLFLLTACATEKVSTSDQTEEKPLLVVNGRLVSADEFIYVYTKNKSNFDSLNVSEDVTDYLDLFINFKLKVAEGLNEGLQNDSTFIQEFQGYKKQLARPYLAESSMTQRLVEEAYERMGEEINASHILITLDPNAPPEDTLNAYNELMSIRERIEMGEDFGALAAQYSDDPSAATNGGDLGYFSAFQMVYPFETAAYTTEIGGISMPFRTQFGYHIVQVKDKRPNRGSLLTAHIMVKTGPQTDSAEARAKAYEIYEKLEEGAEWNDVCIQFSDDLYTKDNGGQIQWFSTGTMVPEYAEAAYLIDSIGDYTEPIKTDYGYHIIKLVEKKPIGSLDQEKSEIARKVSQDTRSQVNSAAFKERLKKEAGYKSYPENIDQLLSKADSFVVDNKWVRPATLPNVPLFILNNQVYGSGDFFDFLVKQRAKVNSPKPQMQRLLDQYTNNQVLAYEEAQLPLKYPEYKYLLNEYYEGILLFQLMDEKVWSLAATDSIGLAKYYAANRDQFTKPAMANVTIYDCIDEQTRTQLLAKIDSTKDNVSKRDLLNYFNKKTALTLQIDSGTYSLEQRPILKNFEWSDGIHQSTYNNRYFVIVVHGTFPAGPLPFDEGRGLVIAAYQDELEAQWVEELKHKYKVNVNKDVLQEVINEIEQL